MRTYTYKVLTYQRGYAMTYAPNHPRANRDGRVREHILIAETALGRFLQTPHEVHHFNGNRSDNRRENLVICEDTNYHRLLHVRYRVLVAGGNPDTDKICTVCKSVKPKTEFHKCKSRGDGLHTCCRACISSGCFASKENL